MIAVYLIFGRSVECNLKLRGMSVAVPAIAFADFGRNENIGEEKTKKLYIYEIK